MNKLLYILIPFSFYCCSSDTGLQPRQLENEETLADTSYQSINNSDTTNSTDIDTTNNIDLSITKSGKKEEDDTTSSTTNDFTGKDIKDIISGYLADSTLDSAIVLQIIDSVTQNSDSDIISNYIETLLQSPDPALFESDTKTFTALSQNIILNEFALEQILGKDLELPEGFTYNLPVLIDISSGGSQFYIPVGPNAEFTNGEMITVNGKVQKEVENSTGFAEGTVLDGVKFILVD